MSTNLQGILFPFLGGLGLFLFSIKYMGDGLQLVAGDKLRYVLDKYTSNSFFALLAGIFVTVLIQSSTGTIVITVSLVGAGLLKIKQAIGIVMGANIGTTVTSFIIGFNISKYALPVMFIGVVFLFFTKNKLLNSIGRIVFGFGGIFYALQLMSGAMVPMKEMSWFYTVLSYIGSSSFAGIAVGTGLTVLIQSSAATIAILQNFYADGSLSLGSSLPVLFGDNIGTAITTAALAMIGANIATKRVAMSHVLFNTLGTVICLIIFKPYTAFIAYMEHLLNLNPKMTIAFAHGTFNVFNTIIQFPFLWLLVIIVTKLIPGEDEYEKYKPQFLDTSLITSAPAIALGQAKKEFLSMMSISKKSLANSIEFFKTKNEKYSEKGEKLEEAINYIDNAMTNYISLLFREKLNNKESIVASSLLDGTRDIERIGDHARDIITILNYNLKKNVNYSEEAQKEILKMYDLSDKMITQTIESLEKEDIVLAAKTIVICDEIYKLEKSARKKHIQRMKENRCEISAGVMYVDFITHFTRVCEHTRNILEKEISGMI